MASNTVYTMVDNDQDLIKMLDALPDLDTGRSPTKPDLFLDLEGEDLSRTGTLSILQILLLSKPHAYLVDCVKLGSAAFNQTNSSGKSLKHILESDSIKKAMFDVRNDSSALYHQYDISLVNVDDLQLMELATRFRSGGFLSGLAKCIDRDISLSYDDRQRCLELKRRGGQLFEPKLGGSYTVFNKRPMDEEILQYCVQDVCILPLIWNTYSKKLNTVWRRKVADEGKARIKSTESVHFNGKGRHMAEPPRWGLYPKNKIPHVQDSEYVLSESVVSNALKLMTDLSQDGTSSSSVGEADEIDGLTSRLSHQLLLVE